MNQSHEPRAVEPQESFRPDLRLVASLIEPNARVLDVGCGDGTLLRLLTDRRGVDARGMELSQKGVNDCVAKGLSVIQGDADQDLNYYADDSFDYVILSQTLQATRHPKQVLENMLRIGKHAIVSFPNFGHWRIRWQIITGGRMPITSSLPDLWYDTPNIHLCSIRDFVNLVERIDAKILRAEALNASGFPIGIPAPWWAWNLLGEQALFLLKRND